MNRLKDAFDDIVRDAPPIGDVAERAMARARRRHWVNWGGSMTAAGLAVAGVTAVALVVAGLPGASPPKQDVSPADDREIAVKDSVLDHQPIRLPETTPDPLPARGVGQVALAYALNCADASDRAGCGTWRVLTADGKHWRVSDAMRPGARGSKAADGTRAWTQPPGLAVSPDGSKLAYFRDDGSFGIRDLETGSFRKAFQIDPAKPYWLMVSVTWSPDSKRVAAHFGLADDALTAKLVDTRTWRVTNLPAGCCVLGLPAGDGPLLMYDTGALADEPNWSKLLVVGSDGTVQRTVPFDQPIDLTEDVVHRHQWARISPDGRSIVGLVDEDEERPTDKNDPRAGTYEPNPQLEVVTISAASGDITSRHRVSELRGLGSTKVLGWSGGSELLGADLAGESYDTAKQDDPAFDGGDVYAVNVRTGTARKAVEFGPVKPTLLSVATGLL